MNPRNQAKSACLGGGANSDSVCKPQLEWKDPQIEYEDIKSIVQKGNVVGEVGFVFREARIIISLVIVLPGQFLRCICFDTNLEICVGINVLEIQFNRFKAE